MEELNKIKPEGIDENKSNIDIKIYQMLNERKKLYEFNFLKGFKMVTTSVEYKAGIFYKKVKLIIEENKLIALDNPESNNIAAELKNPLLVLDFDQVTAGLVINAKSKKFRIKVLGYDNKFSFRVTGKELYEQIIMHLNAFITCSKGNIKNLMGISLRKDFFKQHFIFEKDFSLTAKTGDLLIFRGFECPAKCQRCFTGSQYDHVALLVRRNDNLCVYESTSKDGVKLRYWKEFIQFHWNLLYDKMVYRELKVKMEGLQKERYLEEFQHKTEDFIKETQSKKYLLSCCNLCCAKKTIQESKNEWKDSEGFFCSQLVAAAYLKCSVLQYNRGTGYYLPGSFAVSKKLEFNEQFDLGPEVIIDFST